MPACQRRIQSPVWLTFLCAVAVGCGAGEEAVERYEVSGTVTFNGQPVPVGTIAFEPDLSLGTVAPSGFARIENGIFKTEPGRGAMAGTHVVRIAGFNGRPLRPEERDPASPESTMAVGDPLFPEYTVTIELPGAPSSHTFDVPAPAQ